MGRLIVVSNRIPQDATPSGGLVVAIHEALLSRGGIWIGAAEDVVTTPSDSFAELPGAPYTKLTFDLTQADIDSYYLGYANSVLWPLCHRRSDLMELRPGYLDGYIAVNDRLAQMIADIAQPDDLIWVQDYHFFPLAQALRRHGVTARVGLFLHIPFPTLNDFDALPLRDDFARWIAAYDLVGLQTQGDVASCLEVFRQHAKAELLLDGHIRFGDNSFAVASFPIGIDAKDFAQQSRRTDGRAAVNLMPDEKLVIGIDRLDYSKGIPQRMKAFGHWLDQRSDADIRATLLQIAPPTREAVGAYQDIRDELAQIAGAQNGAHSTLDWTPIRYIHQFIERGTLAGLYRVADVCMVTPLADGMNLVAKEFVAAQEPDDPGVLVLSRFAGAAEQMPEAVIVNPYDIADMAQKLGDALRMDIGERRARHKALAASVFRETIDHWSETYLARLNDLNVGVQPAFANLLNEIREIPHGPRS